MTPQEHKITIQKTARYYTWGDDITRAHRVWFVCHGYGQLGTYFIRNFNELNPETDFVIAPEGFHRFYQEGFSGKVGATWMTKEARLDDIQDYVAYLDLVYDSCGLQDLQTTQNLIALGFSQGVATITRWIAAGKARPHAAVMWAGSFPPDLDVLKATHSFRKLPVWFVLGDADPFIGVNAVDDMKRHVEPLNIDQHWLHFSGKHEIPTSVLRTLLQEINTTLHKVL